jgi:hypothetical protein
MKRTMIAALMMAAATVSHAESWFEFEGGIGANRYGYQGDGTWYQQAAQHEISRNALAFSAGARFNLYQAENWGVRAHVDYVNLGRAVTHCSCTSDANYNFEAHAIVNKAGPYWQFNGSGTQQGIALTIEPYLRYQGWTFGVEGGLFPYRPDWNETVFIDGQQIGINTPHKVQFGKVVGASVERGNLGVSYRHYWLPSRYSDTSAPSFATGADVVMVTYHF